MLCSGSLKPTRIQLEENKKAPAEWSFSSGDEDDSADWWKAADYPPKRPINIELSPENAAVVAYYAPY
jgi:hypothetical protein